MQGLPLLLGNPVLGVYVGRVFFSPPQAPKASTRFRRVPLLSDDRGSSESISTDFLSASSYPAYVILPRVVLARGSTPKLLSTYTATFTSPTGDSLEQCQRVIRADFYRLFDP